jgi:hypothetical protein
MTDAAEGEESTSQSTGTELPRHLVRLPGGDWSIWSCVELRGAGFEAALVLRLAAPDTARIIDRVFEAEDEEASARQTVIEAAATALASSTDDQRGPLIKTLKRLRKGHVPDPLGMATIDTGLATLRTITERVAALHADAARSFEGALERISAALKDAASQGRFREAVTWQNRSALANAVDTLASHKGKEQRRRENLVASYLQRYCTKNDTIGFFGPVAWATLTRAGEPLVLAPGSRLLDARSVHLEQWAVDALAARIASDDRIEPFMAPRVFSFVKIEGERAHSAMTGAHVLSAAQSAVLAACDGTRSARDLAGELVLAHGELFRSENDVFEVLRDLRTKKLVAWTLEVPLLWHPEAELRRRLERVGDEAARTQALDLLDQLERARDDVAASAGDADALDKSLGVIEETFTRVTGAAPTRHAGSMYAARGVVFEDCRRDLRAEIGPQFLDAIGPALSLPLTSARWFTFEAARAYRATFRGIYTDLAKRAGSSAVSFSDAWFRFQRVLFGTKDLPIDAVVASLHERWARILALPAGVRSVRFKSEELRDEVARAFDAPGPGWADARHHCPDIMIAAKSAEAIRSGDYEAVMGEIHVAFHTIACNSGVALHPRPDELLHAMEADLPEPRVLFVPSKDGPRVTLRMSTALVGSKDYAVETGLDTGGPHERILKMSDLVVDDVSGTLVVRSRDGQIAAELIEFFGRQLSFVVASRFNIFARGTYLPRTTIDRLVLSRESWSLPVSELAFSEEKSEHLQFVSARRWARALGLPRFVYVKAAIEVKPLYVDLESPLFVRMLARLVRRMKEDVAGETTITVTEMLPGLEQLWLPGPDGELYTSELRIVARDPVSSGASIVSR